MSELLDTAVKLLREQMPKLETGADRTLEKGIERAREWARTTPEAGEAVRGAMLDALDSVDIAAPHLAHLASFELRALFERVFSGYGANEDTRLTYFRTQATYDERIRAQKEGTLALLEAKLAREESWDAFVEMLKDIGQLALRTVIPVLLAAAV